VRRPRAVRRSGGTPIEEAPLWLLPILILLVWLVAFPALVGLLDGLGGYRGQWREIALGAAVISALIVAGLAFRQPWKRGIVEGPLDNRPLFVRFSTWLLATACVPNVLQGVLVLTREGPPPDYRSSLALGLLISGCHGLLAWLARRRKVR
jgi:hypothetical protein